MPTWGQLEECETQINLGLLHMDKPFTDREQKRKGACEFPCATQMGTSVGRWVWGSRTLMGKA